MMHDALLISHHPERQTCRHPRPELSLENLSLSDSEAYQSGHNPIHAYRCHYPPVISPTAFFTGARSGLSSRDKLTKLIEYVRFLFQDNSTIWTDGITLSASPSFPSIHTTGIRVITAAAPPTPCQPGLDLAPIPCLPPSHDWG